MDGNIASKEKRNKKRATIEMVVLFFIMTIEKIISFQQLTNVRDRQHERVHSNGC